MCSPSEAAVARRSVAARLAVAAAAALFLTGPAVAGGQRISDAKAPLPDSAANHPGELRVCSDPNNLPFSNGRGEGFENRLAELVAGELHKKVVYTWFPQRRGFVRQTLGSNRCDVILGVPAAFDLGLTTRPYYRSTYVFASRRDRALHVRSLDDPRLRTLRVGVHVVGADGGGVPPAQALARRGIVGNVRGYSIYGDYSRPNPPADLIDGLSTGEVDVIIGWGPLVGYFARHSGVPLELRRVSPQVDGPDTPFVFDICMAVRRNDAAFRDALNRVITRKRREIDRLLTSYGVPLLDVGPATAAVHSSR